MLKHGCPPLTEGFPIIGSPVIFHKIPQILGNPSRDGGKHEEGQASDCTSEAADALRCCLEAVVLPASSTGMVAGSGLPLLGGSGRLECSK